MSLPGVRYLRPLSRPFITCNARLVPACPPSHACASTLASTPLTPHTRCAHEKFTMRPRRRPPGVVVSTPPQTVRDGRPSRHPAPRHHKSLPLGCLALHWPFGLRLSQAPGSTRGTIIPSGSRRCLMSRVAESRQDLSMSCVSEAARKTGVATARRRARDRRLLRALRGCARPARGVS